VTGNRVELVVFGKIEKVGVLVGRKNGKKARVRVAFDNYEFCIGSKSVGEVVAGFKVDIKFGGDLIGAHICHYNNFSFLQATPHIQAGTATTSLLALDRDTPYDSRFFFYSESSERGGCYDPQKLDGLRLTTSPLFLISCYLP
jgi:hypothetical protein